MLKLLSCALAAGFLCLMVPTIAKADDMRNAYDFSFTAINGEPMPLEQYEGRVVLVVNTASQCGFTGQYDKLEALWNRYKDRGLTVIGVPSNDFGRQEPGSAEEILDFCRLNYGVTFPLADKTPVSGKDAHPFYLWAGEKAGFLGRPKWNFHKYLIGADGQFLDWFSTPTDPLSDRITRAIEKALDNRNDQAREQF